MSRRHVVIAAVLVVAIVLGAIREFLFINLNYCIDHLAHGRAVNYAHSLFRNAVAGVPLGGLVALKWGFSLFFIVATLGLAIGLARMLFGDYRYTRGLAGGFGIVALVAFVLQAASTAVPTLDPISVKLLHLLQYPVVLFFIWAAAWLQKPST